MTDEAVRAVVGEGADEIWHLRLYVAGNSPKSMEAVANLRVLCDEHLPGRHEIDIIDLVQHPSIAKSDDIIAVPTLVRQLPEPLRRIIGDLSDVDRVLIALHVTPAHG